jgi:hypothetical protein
MNSSSAAIVDGKTAAGHIGNMLCHIALETRESAFFELEISCTAIALVSASERLTSRLLQCYFLLQREKIGRMPVLSEIYRMLKEIFVWL